MKATGGAWLRFRTALSYDKDEAPKILLLMKHSEEWLINTEDFHLNNFVGKHFHDKKKNITKCFLNNTLW
jgi:hypothetical protein